MKTLFTSTAKLLLLSAGLLLPSRSMAQGTNQTASYYEEKTFEIAVFPATAPSKMWVHIDKKRPNQLLHVELLNQKGQVLASEWYSEKVPGIRTRFDLSEIGDGIYTFRISDNHQTQERTFKLGTPGFEEQIPKRLISLN